MQLTSGDLLIYSYLILFKIMHNSSIKFEDEADFGDKNFTVHDEEDAKNFPNNCIGAICLTDNRLIGTGFLIAADLVLTVAHNICLKNGTIL